MRWLALIVPIGRLDRRPFAVAAVCIVWISAASLLLLNTPELVQAKYFPFALLQIVLLQLWFSVHANRLRDAGAGVVRALGLAIFASLLMGILVVAMVEFVTVNVDGDVIDALLNAQFIDALKEFIQEVFQLNENDAEQTALIVSHHIVWGRAALAALLTFAFSAWVGMRHSAAARS